MMLIMLMEDGVIRTRHMAVVLLHHTRQVSLQNPLLMTRIIIIILIVIILRPV